MRIIVRSLSLTSIIFYAYQQHQYEDHHEQPDIEQEQPDIEQPQQQDDIEQPQ